MFCTNCGKQLSEGTRFCIYCGAPVAPAADAQPPLQEEAVPVSAQPVQKPVYQDPVFTAPAQEPVYQDPVFTAPAQEPVYQEPVPYIPTYSDAPAAPAPRRKKKTGLIIAIAVILVLAIAGGVIYYLHSQNTSAYNEAVTLLENRDYDGALAIFQGLGSFQDSADQAARLEQLQTDYNEARAMLENNEFEEAAAAFKKLKDYRDSKEYFTFRVSYQKALYYMDAAAAEDFSVWSDYVGNGSGGAVAELEENQIGIDLYTAAAQLLEELTDYSDSADQASHCWLNAAILYLENGDFSNASTLLDKLNAADAEAFSDSYSSFCTDSKFLADVINIYETWYDANSVTSSGEELRQAYEILSTYIGGHYADSHLESQVNAISEALILMYSVIDTDDEVYDWVTYYTGMAKLYAIADDLQTNYQVFSDNDQAYERYVGYSDYVAPFPVIEQSLVSWWNNDVTADEGDDGNYYAQYTNNTGYNFTLHFYIYFLDSNEKLLETSKQIDISIKKGETVLIPVIPETIKNSEWDYWNMDWWFGNIT